MAKNTEISQVITCPKCGTKIPLSEALLQPFQEVWKKEQDAELNKKLQSVKAKAKEEADQTIGELNDELKETKRKLQEAQKIERELRHQRDELRDREKNLDNEVSRKVDEQTKKVKEELAEEYSLKERQ
jgi:DNA repair exonuclease SbcCD ATPase subunit